MLSARVCYAFFGHSLVYTTRTRTTFPGQLAIISIDGVLLVLKKFELFYRLLSCMFVWRVSSQVVSNISHRTTEAIFFWVSTFLFHCPWEYNQFICLHLSLLCVGLQTSLSHELYTPHINVVSRILQSRRSRSDLETLSLRTIQKFKD